ncbi:hypothetical protein [Polluticaenibacter yanchengensis]|uniref:Uncharacterized protein n=1 Tax=Polluticaenibacter yanchengensis TaxID=3014562 RepID=A0ABT4UL24_9BACT|nr:hypothetical protein [Chitinophagaceae bacterium LY-5]
MSSNNIFFTAFGTFGSPVGFKQSYFLGGDIRIAKHIKTYDIKTDAIKLFPDSSVYAIRRENINDHTVISYCVYSFAKEQGSDRGGTFIGSGLVYVNSIADEVFTLQNLNEFHQYLSAQNVQSDILKVAHSDEFKVAKPKSFDKNKLPLIPVDSSGFKNNNSQQLVVYCDTESNKLAALLKKALVLLEVYPTIYFTKSKEIASFVSQRGLFKFVQNVGELKEFDALLKDLEQEKRQRIADAIAEIEKQRTLAGDEKKILLEKYNAQLLENEKIQAENHKKLKEFKSEADAVSQKYHDFDQFLKGLIGQLNAGEKVEVVNQQYLDNKKIFTESVNQQKPLSFKPVTKTILKTALKTSPLIVENTLGNDVEEPESNDNDEVRLDKFKIASAVLLLLWIGTMVYFLVIKTTPPVIVQVPVADTLPVIKIDSANKDTTIKLTDSLKKDSTIKSAFKK